MCLLSAGLRGNTASAAGRDELRPPRDAAVSDSNRCWRLKRLSATGTGRFRSSPPRRDVGRTVWPLVILELDQRQGGDSPEGHCQQHLTKAEGVRAASGMPAALPGPPVTAFLLSPLRLNPPAGRPAWLGPFSVEGLLFPKVLLFFKLEVECEC